MSQCQKIGYIDRTKAIREMRRMQRTIRNGPIPIRVYWCPNHQRWHLTSKPKNKGIT